MSTNYSNSSFWYNFDDDNDIDILTGEAIKPGKDYVKMAATLRAISNFVRIVTGENIPVKYNNKDESFTDGKTVVISGNIKDKDFDPTVGLALHEGSHCLLTDFSVLKQLQFDEYIDSNFDLEAIAIKYGMFESEWSEEDSEYVSTGKANTNDARRYIANNLKQMLNFVEDRRIDNFIYKNAPGYQGYYEALYDKYFHSNVIDKALQSNEKTSLDLESYMFRLLNITNVNRNFSALPGLMKIWKALDLKNIDRLKTTQDALEVAKEVFNIIESNIPKPEPQQEEKTGGDCEGDSEEGSGNGESTSTVTDEQVEKMIEDLESTVKEAIENGDNTDDGSKAQGSTPKSGKATAQIELSESQKRSLEKAIEKQKQLVNGEIKKTNVSKKDNNNIKAIQESGSETKTVGKGIPKNWHTPGNGTGCLIVRNLTKSLIDSGLYSTVSKGYSWREEDIQQNVNNGLILGTQLGRKLQVRNDERTLKYNRLGKGKMDKRLIASLGYGYKNVFHQIFEERFNPAIVHISVDASGSMSGSKWRNAQKAAIAIAKAASMVGNLDVVISYRSTEHIGSKNTPAIFIAYDSRKDKINKIANLFKYIQCPGTTPEGLCFEAIQKEIVDSSNGIDSYFINFSDGEPYFENQDITYYGDSAAKHTRTQVENMRDRGIKVLGYFIGGGYGDNGNFKTMYGKGAEFIDTNQVVPLAKTLNKMFATK
ncbi:hypothetical protein CMI47_20530 [Candidatus Pacearchaeota archaeon]|nr:hypothetical protein [Candidatus Pacearchaeota archaeon]